ALSPRTAYRPTSFARVMPSKAFWPRRIRFSFPTAIGGSVIRGNGGDALRLRVSETIYALVLVGALAWLPAWSIQLAAWSENLEPLPWASLGGVLAGWALARSRWRPMACHLL